MILKDRFNKGGITKTIKTRECLQGLSHEQIQQIIECYLYEQQMNQAREIIEELMSDELSLREGVFRREDYIRAMDVDSYAYVLDIIVETYQSMQSPHEPDALTWSRALSEAMWFLADVCEHDVKQGAKYYTSMTIPHLLRYVYRHAGQAEVIEFFTANSEGGLSHNKFNFYTANFGENGIVICRCFRTGNLFAWRVEDPADNRGYPAFASAAKSFLEAENTPFGTAVDDILVAE